MSRGPECDDGKVHNLDTIIVNGRPRLHCSKCNEIWEVGKK